ncbi:MAG: hypothetical protein GY822_01115 [Deltaproteobacteria bacterium]|nr:hypothetical protein [Deltaproteobacteria bacterium]
MEFLRRPSAWWTLFVQAVEIAAQTAIALLSIRVMSVADWGVLAFALYASASVSTFIFFGAAEMAILDFATKSSAPRTILMGVLGVLKKGFLRVFILLLLAAIFLLRDVEGVVVFGICGAALMANGAASAFHLPLIANEKAGLGLLPLVAVRLSQMLLIGGQPLVDGSNLSPIWVAAVHLLGALALGACRARLVHHFLFKISFRSAKGATRDLGERGKCLGYGSIFGQVSNRMDGWMLQGMSNEIEVGGYLASVRVLHGLAALWAAISISVFPKLTKSKSSLSSKWILWTGCSVLPLLWAGLEAESWVPLLFGADFEFCVPVVRWLLAASAAQAFTAVGAKILITHGRAKLWMKIQVVGALANFAANLVLIPRFGGLGAAMATATSSALCTLLFFVWWACKKRSSADS